MHLRLWERDVYLHTLPMFHANGWGLPYPLAGLGAKQVVLRKVDGAEILRRIDRARRHADVRSPGGVERGTRRGGRWDGDVPGRGRVRIVCAGAPPPTRMIQRIDEELGWEFIQIYGLTETSPIVTFNRTRPADQRTCRPGTRTPVGPRRCTGARRAGKGLRRRGGARPVERRARPLLEQPGRHGRSAGDGWFHTGDGGTLDDEGHLTISDRKKDVIITGGENVSSIEVEDCIFASGGRRSGRDRRARREVGRDYQGTRRPRG